ncbi:MAG: hypothetical protein IPN96_16025 [Anaerolineales bacterium]|nr:hypothetical protein [Anaerolineales bacterium]
MEVLRPENLPPPPGIINSIKAGFDTIATHITAILLPLLLNVFLWLGPRLRMDALFDSIKADVVSIWQTGGVSPEDIQRVLTWYDGTIPTVNLFWLIRTIPIGISTLFLSQGDSQTPLGAPAIMQVNALSLLGWMFLLTLIGWVGGGLYFRSVAKLAIVTENEKPLRISRAIIQTILTSIIWGILAVVIGVPLFIVLAVVLQFNAFYCQSVCAIP